MPEGPKKRFLETAPAFPLSEGLNPPLPPDEKLVGMGTTCLLHRFVQSRILDCDNEWSLLPRFILNVEKTARDSKVKAKVLKQGPLSKISLISVCHFRDVRPLQKTHDFN